jgi:hypothetical protein
MEEVNRRMTARMKCWKVDWKDKWVKELLGGCEWVHRQADGCIDGFVDKRYSGQAERKVKSTLDR